MMKREIKENKMYHVAFYGLLHQEFFEVKIHILDKYIGDSYIKTILSMH